MTEMTCNQVEEAATEYALGILPAGESRAVSAHLLQCRACQEEVERIQKVGEQLFDVVPDAEPPLGFDERVLSAVRPHRARRVARRRVFVAAAAAAVVIVATITATAVSGHHHSTPPAQLTAALHQGDRNVGSIHVGGHPAWISMTVSDLSLTGTVSCQLIARDGTVSNIGTFQLVDGSGSWGTFDPYSRSQLATARLVGPTGTVLATASFSST